MDMNFGIPQFMGFMRGYPTLFAPDKGAGAGGGKPKAREGKGLRRAGAGAGAGGKGKPPARGKPAPKEPPSRTPPDEEEDIEEEADEEEDIEEEDVDEEDEETDDDEEEIEAEEEEADEEEADEEDDDDQKKSKGGDKKKPKLVRVPADELKRLRAREQETENAEKKAARARARAATEREEKIAEKNASKALNMARKRLQRDIDQRDDTISTLRARNERLEARLNGAAISTGLHDALDAVMEERGQRLRKGAIRHISKSIAGQFEVHESEDDEEIQIVHRETGESLEDFLAEALDTDEYSLFVEDSGEARERETPSRPKGTHKGTSRAAAKDDAEGRPSYAGAYHKRVKQLEKQEGVKPAIGLRRAGKT